MKSVDVIIAGGGAAGLMCALTAARRGRSVVVLEHGARLGNKILISGGGRCNFTNLHVEARHYLTQGSPDFCKSALARFQPADFLAMVEQHGIAWHEKKLGQLFCDGSSKQIVAMLESECAAAGATMVLGAAVQDVRREAQFRVATSQGEFKGASLVIATGGLSFPQLGVSPLGYRVAEQFGLKVIPPRPGLAPLVFHPEDAKAFGELSGVSVDVSIRAVLAGPAFRENLLFTHRGLSGPAVLQASSYRREGEEIVVDLLPGRSAAALLNQERGVSRELKTVLSQWMPQRVAEAWCRRQFPSRPMSRLSHAEIREAGERLNEWRIQPAGDEGYPKAEVTVGGVDTAELSSKTLESWRVPGLYFIGEVVDVTGWLGGYNFQWAWASGHAAGQRV
ncbi:MAG: NAD(P)/FAD-dependent oxidoreductase [Verrucomicrobia bacterium]|nr:NAD(P)/FAD-dependent oxidoreductase [Verrucomicrobiota bacterium]MBI3867491.1 NAD(P)/FAD-dependent oxidoreductase [Verrucomicrobiota bacterium]